jgi:hypothetical protein
MEKEEERWNSNIYIWEYPPWWIDWITDWRKIRLKAGWPIRRHASSDDEDMKWDNGSGGKNTSDIFEKHWEKWLPILSAH